MDFAVLCLQTVDGKWEEVAGGGGEENTDLLNKLIDLEVMHTTFLHIL